MVEERTKERKTERKKREKRGGLHSSREGSEKRKRKKRGEAGRKTRHSLSLSLSLSLRRRGGGRTTPFVRKRGEPWEVRQRVMHSRPASPKSSNEKTWPTTRTRTRTTSRKVLPSNSLSTLRLPSLDQLQWTSVQGISSSVVLLTTLVPFFPLSFHFSSLSF